MAKLFPILLVNFIGTLGFSIVLPFLVFLVTKFGGDAILFGLLAAVYPALQLVGAPILGRLSDLHGRREILLVSQIGTLAAWIIFVAAFFLPIEPLFVSSSLVLTLPLLMLFFARGLDGITGGNVSVANAYLADVTSEKNRKKDFGNMAVSANLGFIVGPALAGVLGATFLGELLPVLAALLISVVATIVIAFFLPESKPCAIEKDPEQKNIRKIFGHEHKECFKRVGERMSMKKLFSLPLIPYLMVLYFLIFLGFNLFYTAFPIHAIEGLGWSITELGIFFSFLGLVMVIVQGPVLSRLKVRESYLIIVGGIILGLNFILLTAGTDLTTYVAAVFFAGGNGIMWPSFLSLLSKATDSAHQGAVQGFGSSFGSLASIIGLIAGGFLFSFIGGATFLISALIIFVVVILSLRLLRLNT